MGFEYKIIAKLSEKQISEIQNILELKIEFDKKYEFDNKTFYDLRLANNKGKMPNISISLESDGVYICRYEGGHLWKNLKELKEYIDDKHIKYTLLDYQD